ncbi:hypothetical protein ON010_g11383 [Phytophthora cinnamomi]|nr:hypothetical protein ON010_g11383 [Phytophthora cinnamomi]
MLDFTDGGPIDDGRSMITKMPYRQAVGALFYLAGVSRPDIMFSVGQLARHTTTPRKVAWDAVKYQLGCLGAAKNLRLKFQPTSEDIVVTTVPDWANDHGTAKACLVTCVPVRVSRGWMSKKQTIVSKSSTAAEYVAADVGTEEALMIQMIANEVL